MYLWKFLHYSKSWSMIILDLCIKTWESSVAPHRVKLWLVMKTFHVWLLAWVLVIVLPIQLPVNTPMEAVMWYRHLDPYHSRARPERNSLLLASFRNKPGYCSHLHSELAGGNYLALCFSLSASSLHTSVPTLTVLLPFQQEKVLSMVRLYTEIIQLNESKNKIEIASF